MVETIMEQAPQNEIEIEAQPKAVKPIFFRVSVIIAYLVAISIIVIASVLILGKNGVAPTSTDNKYLEGDRPVITSSVITPTVSAEVTPTTTVTVTATVNPTVTVEPTIKPTLKPTSTPTPTVIPTQIQKQVYYVRDLSGNDDVIVLTTGYSDSMLQNLGSLCDFQGRCITAWTPLSWACTTGIPSTCIAQVDLGDNWYSVGINTNFSTFIDVSVNFELCNATYGAESICRDLPDNS